jgi:hypothetical protein
MFSRLRIGLIAFLVLLQLVAPLVHAHTGTPIFAAINSGIGKLHVPGLESLSLVSDVGLPGQYWATLNAPPEGLVVGIDTGIKPADQGILAAADHVYYLHQPAHLFAASFSVFDVNFSPHTTPFVSPFTVTAHSPRAPPVLFTRFV